VRTTQSFFISVGIHLGLAVLLLMTAGIIHKNLSPSPEKTKLKIMLSTPESSTTPPTPHLVEPKPKEPIQKPQLQEPLKQPKIVPQAVVPLPIQSKPAPSVIQTTQTLSVPAPKTVEPVAVAAPKAPPSPPKVEENYEEENLGKIRSILAERLKYPKNALRLKQQGECMVAFTLEPTREVHHITVIQSSGFEMLDNAAKELIETSANEFPKPKKSVRISVPISYKLR
jgi:protein TonB